MIENLNKEIIIKLKSFMELLRQTCKDDFLFETYCALLAEILSKITKSEISAEELDCLAYSW